MWTASIVVSALGLAACLAGCVVAEDADVIATQVKAFEGDDVEVKSCERIGDAAANDEVLGAMLVEAWKCDVRAPDGRSGFTESCYAGYAEEPAAILRGLPCASVDRGCPPGGRRLRGGEVFLGPVTDVDLEYEEEIGRNPADRTVRVDVSYEGEHCGYIDVRLPVTPDDPLDQAAELMEEKTSWAEPGYTFSYRLKGEKD